MVDQKRSRGRPRQPRKTEQILEAIRTLVCEDGLVALTMEGVARRAQVSKTTLYRRFSSKKELIVHYVESINRESVGDEFAHLDLPQDPRERLIAMGAHLMTLVTREDIVRFDNAIAAAAPRFPEVAKAFAEASLGRAALITQNALLEAQAAGLLRVEDLEDEASILLSLWAGGCYEPIRFLGNAAWPPERIARHVEARTDNFLALMRVSP